MYTDTVQTFVILGGAFILMGYGTELSQGGGAQSSQGYQPGGRDTARLQPWRRRRVR